MSTSLPPAPGDVPPDGIRETRTGMTPPPPPRGAPGLLATSGTDLLGLISECRLLEPQQLDELPSLLVPEPRAFGEALVARGWLTRFQAECLLSGQVNELALGQYVLLELLGEGGMGRVFKARHRLMQRIVAIKVIRREYLVDEDAVARFHREIRAASQLNHPNVITAYDADQVGNTHFFAMEFVEGVDLARLLQYRGPLPVAEACDCIRQAALGLHHAHERGVIHRDVKPSNLLLTAREGLVKVLDLGLARRAGAPGAEQSAALTQGGVLMGTPDYMAPEQAQNSHDVDGRADIYSLGCTFYTLLTGQPPFPNGSAIDKVVMHQTAEPRPVEELRPEVPRAVGRVLRTMMARFPDARYSTAAAVAEALAPLSGPVKPASPWSPRAARPADSHSLTPRIEEFAPPSPRESATKRPRRRRRLAIALVLLCALVGLLATVGFTFLTRAPSTSDSQAAAPTTTAAPSTPAPPAPKLEPTKPAPVVKPPAVVDLVHRFQAGEPVRCVVFDPRPEAGLALSCGDYALRQWDLKARKQLPELRIEKHTDQLIWSVACSFDGRFAVCGTGGYIDPELANFNTDHFVLLIDRESQNVRASFRRLDGKQGHNDRVVSVAFAPDGRRVASGSLDRTVSIWNVTTGKEICTCRGHEGRVRCVAFPPRSGEVVASGGQEGIVCVWDANSGKLLELHRGHKDAVLCVAFSPDGHLLASAGIDGTVRLWNRDNEKDVRIFRGHGAAVRAVAFLPDGERLLSGGDDGVLRLWSANNLQEIKQFAGHTAAIASVSISADGKQALSGSEDRSIILWSLPPLK
jgi:serine/threonine protein kinase